MSHPDFAVAGSGLGDWPVTTDGQRDGRCRLIVGFPDRPGRHHLAEGDVAWAQILGSVRTRREGVESDVPYWNTGVFARGEDDAWSWRYWGGAEPQEEPRV
jgi:hypothetical protein